MTRKASTPLGYRWPGDVDSWGAPLWQFQVGQCYTTRAQYGPNLRAMEVTTSHAARSNKGGPWLSGRHIAAADHGGGTMTWETGSPYPPL